MRSQLLFNVHCTHIHVLRWKISINRLEKSTTHLDNFVNENKTTSGNGKTAYQRKESTPALFLLFMNQSITEELLFRIENQCNKNILVHRSRDINIIHYESKCCMVFYLNGLLVNFFSGWVVQGWIHRQKRSHLPVKF